MTDDEFQDFIITSGDELESKQESLTASYSLGQYKEFWFDQPSGKLQFKDANGAAQVEATVTPIGSFSKKSSTWQWGWANKSLLESLRSKGEKLKELSDLTGIESFRLPCRKANEEMAWEMSAMAVHLLSSLGCYKMPAGELEIFLAIDNIKRLV